MTAPIHDLASLRGRVRVFRDRRHAGELLANMLRDDPGLAEAIALAIPAGGVPVAAAIAERLGLPLDVCVVSKVLLPWTTEAGFGAVAFDGTEWINREYVDYYRLTPSQVDKALSQARHKVARRVHLFRDDRPFPDLHERPVILVDDGLAAGSTLRAAITALQRHGAQRIIVAVPTAPTHSALAIAPLASALYVANLRSGPSFAVADAYRHWHDVEETEVMALLDAHRHDLPEAGTP